MAYYCGECKIWRGSQDENAYGERWCAYSRRYERSDQNTYGCRGFIYAERAVLTKVCELLSLDAQPWFAAFDRVREQYLLPCRREWLMAYCAVGPQLAERMDADNEGIDVAQTLLQKYLVPARRLAERGAYQQAAEMYRGMVSVLKKRYVEGADK